MTRSRIVLIAFSFLSAFASFVACGGDDNHAGDDSSANDSGTGSDTTVGRDGAPQEAGSDSGLSCTATPCVVSIGVGGLHSCAILDDGTIRCWGGNLLGALGSGTLVDGGGGTFTPKEVATPVAVPGISNAKLVGGGGIYPSDFDWSCALLADKTVDCWGSDGYGTLARGDASIPSDTTPESVGLTNAVDLAAGQFASCAVLSNGDIACWGENGSGDVAPPQTNVIFPTPTILDAGGAKFAHVSVGILNACALSSDGHVWCWGFDADGENGHYTDGGPQDEAVAQAVGLDSAVDMAAGYEASCAVKIDGSVWCWGANIDGQLGSADGGPSYAYAPAAVSMPAGKKFTRVVGHVEGFCALADDGTVWCWGNTSLGVAGSGTLDAGTIFPAQLDEPTQVQGLSDVVQIASTGASAHTCALIRNGAVKCWGFNLSSQLGTAPVDGGIPFSIAPLDVSFF